MLGGVSDIAMKFDDATFIYLCTCKINNAKYQVNIIKSKIINQTNDLVDPEFSEKVRHAR
jgi:hypothetical protein